MTFFNLLKFDLYKIIKAKSFYIVCAFAFLIEAANILFLYLNGAETVFPNAMHWTTGIYGVAIFTIVFVCKDFKSGYYKNIATDVNRFYYVLSKATVIAIVVVFIRAVIFLFDVLCCYCFGNRTFCAKNTGYVLSEYIATMLLDLWCLTMLGIVIEFLCIWLKSELISFAPYFIYITFFSSMVCQKMQDWFGKGVRRLLLSGHLVGVYNYIGHLDESLICLVVTFIWGTLALIGSWLLLLRKRRVIV